MKKKGIGLTLGLMCFVLSFAVLIQIKTVEESDSEALKTYNEDQLRTQVLQWKDKYDETYKKLQDNEVILEEYRNAATREDEATEIINSELRQANAILGLSNVEGKGIILHLDDTSKDFVGEPISDIELLRVVNELRAAGAEAISINGQRILTNSEIRIINSREMVINGESIVSPYTVKAIGNPENLESALKIKRGILEELRTFGIAAGIEVSDEITINKYNGVIQFKYATIAE